jgi:hypothetical protein
MTNTASKTPAQVTSKSRISNRVQALLDRVEKAMREIEIAVEAFDAELDELTGLISEDVDDRIGSLRVVTGSRHRCLHLETEGRLRGLRNAIERGEDGAEATS